MRRQRVWQKSFGFLGSTPIIVEPSAGALSSDAGLLPLRQFDEAFGMTRQFADALEDQRYQPFVDHSLLEMVRMRVYQPVEKSQGVAGVDRREPPGCESLGGRFSPPQPPIDKSPFSTGC